MMLNMSILKGVKIESSSALQAAVKRSENV